jgi:hypothetical protein
MLGLAVSCLRRKRHTQRALVVAFQKFKLLLSFHSLGHQYLIKLPFIRTVQSHFGNANFSIVEISSSSLKQAVCSDNTVSFIPLARLLFSSLFLQTLYPFPLLSYFPSFLSYLVFTLHLFLPLIYPVFWISLVIFSSLSSFLRCFSNNKFCTRSKVLSSSQFSQTNAETFKASECE